MTLRHENRVGPAQNTIDPFLIEQSVERVAEFCEVSAQIPEQWLTGVERLELHLSNDEADAPLGEHAFGAAQGQQLATLNVHLEDVDALDVVADAVIRERDGIDRLCAEVIDRT